MSQILMLGIIPHICSHGSSSGTREESIRLLATGEDRASGQSFGSSHGHGDRHSE